MLLYAFRTWNVFPPPQGMLPFPETGESRTLTETKVFGEKYVLGADAKHSDLLHPSLPKSGAHSTGQMWGVLSPPRGHPCPSRFPFSPPSKLSAGQAILLKTLFHPLE